MQEEHTVGSPAAAGLPPLLCSQLLLMRRAARLKDVVGLALKRAGILMAQCIGLLSGPSLVHPAAPPAGRPGAQQQQMGGGRRHKCSRHTGARLPASSRRACVARGPLPLRVCRSDKSTCSRLCRVHQHAAVQTTATVALDTAREARICCSEQGCFLTCRSAPP